MDQIVETLDGDYRASVRTIMPTVIYLRIDESCEGYAWEVRALNEEMPLEQGRQRFNCIKTAREDGMRALARLSRSIGWV